MAELKKTLGFWMVAAIAFLGLINTGIFFGVQIGAGKAGSASLIAWAILAIVSVYCAMSIAELVGMFPSAGGVYEFYKQGTSRFTSFLVGWTTWVSGCIATALFTVAAIDYIMPDYFVLTLGPFVLHAAMLKVIIPIILIIILNIIAYHGIEASARVMFLLSIFTALIIAAILFPGVLFVHSANYQPFLLQWGGIFVALFLLTETFFGWESVSFLAEETIDAQIVIPKALVRVTIVVAIIAVLNAVVMIGVLGATNVAGLTVSHLLTTVHAQSWMLIINIGICLTLLGNTSGDVVSLPRLLLAMGRDKLFIEQFSDVHPKYQTPYKAIIFQTIIASLIVIAAAGAYQRLLELLVPLGLLVYAGLLILVTYFRFKVPQQPRPYKAPAGKILPAVVACFYIFLLLAWAIREPAALGELRLLFSFIFFSIPIYLILTYFYDPDQLISTMNFFSRINLWFENFLVPKRIRNEILDFFRNAKDKRILEFGSGVGTLTVHLADHVGKGGKVYAVGLSAGDVKILQHRMNKLGHTHVEVIHDPHLVNRVHPNVKEVDMIVSIGHLSYIQDVKKVLREMNSILPQNGHICFVEYIDLFYFLPNPKWLSDPIEIKRVFAEAGFAVTVHVRQGIFWKYLYIYGIKESRNVSYI